MRSAFPRLLCHHLLPLAFLQTPLQDGCCTANLLNTLGKPGPTFKFLNAFNYLPSPHLSFLLFLKFAMTYLPLVYMLVKLSMSFSLFRIRLKKQYHKTFMMCSIVQLLIPLFPPTLHSLTGFMQPWHCITVGDLPFLTFSVFYTVFMCIDSVNIHIHFT